MPRTLIFVLAFAVGLVVGWCAGADLGAPEFTPTRPATPAPETTPLGADDLHLCPGAESCEGRGTPLPMRTLL